MFPFVISLVASVAAALVVGLLITRQGRRALVAERSETVQAVVDQAMSVATARLNDSLAAGSRELGVRAESFEVRVGHVTDALERMGALVGQLQTERASQTGSLVAQLEQVALTQQQLAEHTGQLRQALASPKQRGQWGERMAEDVLRAAGFVEGIQFHRQKALAGGTVPDFNFLLPNDLQLRMDVKFPVDNYLRVLEADGDADRARFTKAFSADVRSRIRELAPRGYVDANDTVDCMLLFIPNEAVYAFLHEAEPDIVDVALAHKVVLCSPSTLFAVLAVVRRAVEQFRLERTSDEILRQLGSVTDEWSKFQASLDKVQRQVDQLHTHVSTDLNGTRRRQFERRLDGLASLSSDEVIERAADAALDRPVGPGDELAARKAVGDVRALTVESSRAEPPRPASA